MAQKDVTFGLEFRGKRWDKAAIGLRYFANNLSKSVELLGPVVSKELQELLEGIVEAMAQRHGNPWPGGTTSNSLSVRSGKGLQSIKDGIEVIGKTLDDIQGVITVGFPMSVHETGAVIRPKKAQYLTIPLPAALNSNGTPKKKSAREWENTFIARSKKGNLIIFQRQLSQIVPLYVLKKRVEIPARLGMQDTIDAAIPYFVDRTMDAMVRELMKQL